MGPVKNIINPQWKGKGSRRSTESSIGNETSYRSIGGNETSDNGGNETSDIGSDILEYFDNLNWDVVERSEYKKCMTSFLPCEEDNVTKSHALALIYSQRYPFPEEEYNISSLKSKEGASYDYYVPGVEDKAILIPLGSQLSKQEQYSLYVFLRRIHFNNEPLDQTELFQYQDLIQRAEKDHSNFHQFVVSQWMRNHCRRSLEIPASVHEYINKLWENQLNQCLALYPHLYMKKTYIPLALNDPNNDHSVMEPNKVVTMKGCLQKLIFPKIIKGCELLTDLHELCQIKQVCPEERSPEVKPITSPAPSASIDPVVDMCIEKENIDVVITPSAIKTIVDIYQVHKDWILPVTVKNVFKVSGELNKKVVIIDKKLPPREMSIYDKNVKHAKIAAKWSLILTNAPHLLDTQSVVDDTEREIPEYDDLVTEELEEEFGVDNCSPVTSCKKKLQDHLSSAAIDKDKVCNKLENLSITGNGTEETKEVTNGLEHVSQNNRKRKSISDSLAASTCVSPPATDTSVRHKLVAKSISDSPAASTCASPPATNTSVRQKLVAKSISDSPAASTCASPPATDTSVRHKLVAKRKKSIKPLRKYAIWDLHKSKHFNMSKQEQRSLKVLVRSRVDGRLIHNKNNKRCESNVFVSSKLEYQPEFGASKMSKSEVVREYVDTLIRETDLCRIRVVGHTKELMMFEVKSLLEIKDHLQRSLQVETQKVFDPLYAVLTKLIDVPVGRYMLQHTSKMEAFSQLLSESAQRIDFNLTNHCGSPETTEVNLQAAQIDPFLLTKIHFRERKPPALFRPTDNSGKYPKKPYLAKRKRVKKKKKKKGGKEKKAEEGEGMMNEDL